MSVFFLFEPLRTPVAAVIVMWNRISLNTEKTGGGEIMNRRIK